jgi:predicted DNA-binding transcriptional regulator YafY
MGNTTNPKRWDAKRRLEFIERTAFWRGYVQRSDLAAEFGISLPQATADLQAYLELNPRSLEYDLSAKRYVAAPEMTLKLTMGDLGRAIADFLGKESKGAVSPDRVASIDLPYRALSVTVSRDLFRAVTQGLALEIHYLSINSSTEIWRWITPHAFAHDGYRWHVRAFCHRDKNYKDFVIGRISITKPPVAHEPPLTADTDWNTWETLKLRPHSKLTETQRRAIELDFEMKRGVVSLNVRRSMKIYTLAYLRLINTDSFPRLLELV